MGHHHSKQSDRSFHIISGKSRSSELNSISTNGTVTTAAAATATIIANRTGMHTASCIRTGTTSAGLKC